MTPTQRLAAKVLGRPLSEYVAERRTITNSSGLPRGWVRIAHDLFIETAGEIDVTGQTLYNWYGKEQS